MATPRKGLGSENAGLGERRSEVIQAEGDEFKGRHEFRIEVSRRAPCRCLQPRAPFEQISHVSGGHDASHLRQQAQGDAVVVVWSKVRGEDRGLGLERPKECLSTKDQG